LLEAIQLGLDILQLAEVQEQTPVEQVKVAVAVVAVVPVREPHLVVREHRVMVVELQVVLDMEAAVAVVWAQQAQVVLEITEEMEAMV
jgi:hypothetical protein